MSDFEDIAHKTVAELFDMLKEKQYTVDALSEINHEKDSEIADLKAQLNNMEACYIQVKKDKAELLGVISDALEAFNDGEFNYCQKQLEMHAKPLRGDCE